MIQLSYEAVFILLSVFGVAMRHTWITAHKSAYEDGYHNACYDVAVGNIKVEMENEE